MKFNRKFATVLLALLMMMTQSGCIVGFIVTPLIIPFTVTGTLVGVAGGVMLGTGAFNRNQALLGAGAGLIIAGAILDKDNPGQMDAMNPISRDKAIAKELGVSIDDITDYNNNLNQIREVALELSNDLRAQLKRPEFKGIPNLQRIAGDSQVDSLARKYGFNSGQEFVETFKSDKLSQQVLDRFSQATRISTTDAKILLKFGFAVNTI